MVEIIVTGYGRFATGMASAPEFILGEQPCVETVDFTSLADTD
ncbi:hypothetical protein [Olsenella sp. Marseille-P4559]|jgi:mannose/fructose-specific phosphotransferase system component IIA|nr:hypothetical protein [Olsenella sp. Marseille-P4559]